MENILKRCVTCLSERNLSNINEIKDGISCYEKIKICIPQLVSDEYNMEQGFLCVCCQIFINNFYQFFDNCMKSKNIIENMVCNLKGNNSLRKNKLTKINDEIHEHDIDDKDDLKLCILNEVYKDDNSPVKPQKNENNQIIIEFIDVGSSNILVENDDITDDALRSESIEKESTEVTPSSTNYSCDKCGKVFSKIWNLKSHIKYRHANDENPENVEIGSILLNEEIRRKFNCNSCDKTFVRLHHLKSHIKYKHNLEREYRCLICDKYFAEIGNLRKHINVHKDKYKYQCEKCSFRYLTEEELTAHKNKLRCYSKEKIKCKFCNSCFHREAALRRHMNDRHIKEKLFVCDLCGTRFLRNYSLQVHKKNKHGGKDITCELCNKKFATNGILRKHIKVHFNDGKKNGKTTRNDSETDLYNENKKNEPINAPNINDEITALNTNDETAENKTLVPDITDLNNETTEETKKDSESETSKNLTSEGTPRFQCDLCGKLYSGNLDKHLRTHKKETLFRCTFCPKTFPEKSIRSEHIRRVHNNEKNHVCHICGKAFFNSYQLKHHIKLHTTTEIYYCQICEKRFKEANNLKKHQLLHLGVLTKKFECDVCNRKVWTNADLIRHKRTHTGEKPYACEICGKRFAIKQQIGIHHSFNHVEERQYSCTVCNKRFATKGCLNKHMKSHSQIRPYKCEYCSKAFLQRYHVQKHLNRGSCKNYNKTILDDR